MIRLAVKILLLANAAVWAAVAVSPDDKFRVIFCDVGQGDAILLTRGRNQVLVDTGPDEKVLKCLARHMPFYDRKLEGLLVTHPEQDHMGAAGEVLDRYRVELIITGQAGNATRLFADLVEKVEKNQVPVRVVHAGDRILAGGWEWTTIWPTGQFTDRHLVGENRVLGMTTDGTNTNSFSIGGILSFGEFDVLLTGDADVTVEGEMLAEGRVWEVEIMKVPHHGSRTGMSEEWLERVNPAVAVISAGKNNRYGHPAAEILEMLNRQEVRVQRTDKDGEVVIASDGKRWWFED